MISIHRCLKSTDAAVIAIRAGREVIQSIRSDCHITRQNIIGNLLQFLANVLKQRRKFMLLGAVSLVLIPQLAVLLAESSKREGLAVTKFTDRKSTRLNSSHANISYAVFCLKKKKRM